MDRYSLKGTAINGLSPWIDRMAAKENSTVMGFNVSTTPDGNAQVNVMLLPNGDSVCTSNVVAIFENRASADALARSLGADFGITE